jgi:hypothetical protein
MTEKELSVKVLKGPRQISREASETIWARFDRLQKSLKPLRQGQRIRRGIHYGRGT